MPVSFDIDVATLSQRPEGLPATLDSLSQSVQKRDSHFPRNTRVGYGLSILEASWAGRWEILATFHEIRLDHDTHDVFGSISRLKLLGLIQM
jgi:hypothetical protein